MDRRPDGSAGGAPVGADGEEENGTRVGLAVRRRLADHLLVGRATSDVGQGLLAVLTTFVFWHSASPVVALAWLGAVLAWVAVRALYRRKVLRQMDDVGARLRRLRADVLSSAALWGFGGPLLIGPSDTDLALLLLMVAGLIAAATSTVVADRPAFYGFTALLLLPVLATIVAGGVGRLELSLALVVLLYAPFMLLVHERAHRVLRGQFASEERLRISEEVVATRSEFLNALLDAAPNPILALGADHRIIGLNPAFGRVTGHDRMSVLGRPLEELVDTLDGKRRLGAFLRGIDHGERGVVEVRVRHGDGHLTWLRLTGTPSSKAGVGTAILMGEDVTAEVETREAMHAARLAAEESARAKSRFLASMSHEIRTPMNGVMGMIELLLDSPLDEQQRDWAEVLRGSADNLLAILNDILDISKIEAGQLRLENIPLDLPQLLSECLRAFAHPASSRGIELLLEVDPAMPAHVEADPLRLRQVLSNLLSNAIKFTDSGEVSVCVAAASSGEGPVNVTFSVRDTGIGIPADKRHMIFEEFSQADASTTRTHGGTGLGLAICRRLVRMMGGDIQVESVVGHGSVFSFTIPMRVGGAPTRDVVHRPTERLEGRRLLVIDDNAAARRIVRGVVEADGATLEEAASAREGIALLNARVGTERAYDLVVLDALMPDLDGFAVAEALHALPGEPKPPLLMLTSAASAKEADRARALGVRGFLEKPVSRRRLLQAIGIVLAPPRADGPERRMVTSGTLEHIPRSGRILVADDSKVNQHVAVAMLEKRGYVVDVADNGRVAVDVALAGCYDLVLMDLEMPVMDGVAATREIRAHRDADELPIVALTAHALVEERERCLGAGMNDFLLKPIKPEALYAVCDRWSGGPATSERAPRGREHA